MTASNDHSGSDAPPDGITVVKVSGTLLGRADDMRAFWESIANLASEGPVVLVHGGGQQATELAERLGHTPRVVQGRRVTTDLDLDIVQWALCGKINTQLVAAARRHGLRAVGLSGADDALLQVRKRPAWTVDGETVDFGWVGDVTGVQPDVVVHLLSTGRMPIIAPLGIDDDGQVYNVNADTVAQNVAVALGASHLLLVTATGGVRRDAGSARTRLDTCDRETVAEGIENGWIEGGMRVKVETALAALDHGVREAFICAASDLLTRSDATRVTR
ncbi:MAG: acetylglutamate kinase [Bacteroidetes bacterium]|jgi:acetylglutamate kinase|nr:acetylglutamate kinase [Bacteroidota bacterium]